MTVATPAVNDGESDVAPAAPAAEGQDTHAASTSPAPEAARAAEVVPGVAEVSRVAPPVTAEGEPAFDDMLEYCSLISTLFS